MKYLLLVIIIIFSSLHFLHASTIYYLKINDRIEKKDIKVKSYNMSITNDCEIDITYWKDLEIEGLSVSGSAKLLSDSSLVRITILDNNNTEYLVFESSIVSNDLGVAKFDKAFEETFMIEKAFPAKLTIQIIDAELSLKEIEVYQLDDSKGFNYKIMKNEILKEIHLEKLNQVKKYIKKKNLYWSAMNSNFSTMSYRHKKKIFGEKFNTYGFEYYSNGFFSIPNSLKDSNPKLKSGSTYVDEFDWRNRHGSNWITSNKCQSGCYFPNYIDCNYYAQDWNTDSLRCANDGGVYREVGTCWAFSAVGTLEALTNLYFNQHLDYDLSEQQVVSCAHGNTEPWYLDNTLDYIRNNYVVNEACYPYMAADGVCDDVCDMPTDKISFSSYTYISLESSLKSGIISNGPLAAKMYSWSHVLVCVGWSKIKAYDVIDFQTNTTIQPGDPIIGSTYWILKQSNTQTGWPDHTGYIYMIDKPNYAYRINSPIISEVYDDSDIVCQDNDNDGYYWWGIGDKPSHCNPCCSDEPDGDDSNPSLGPMDSYGNCTVLNSQLSCPYEVTGNETWTSSKNDCGGYLVKSGAYLTIDGANIEIPTGRFFEVELGGTLTMNSGTIQ